MTIFTIGCVAIVIGVGAVIVFCFWGDDTGATLLGLAVVLFGLMGVKGVDEYSVSLNQYIPAEPIVYNSNQTVFNTEKGNIIANGIYPDGEYLLDMDGDTVLVIWQAVNGEEVGLG